MGAAYVKTASRSLIGLIVVVLLAVLGNYLFTMLRPASAPKKAPEILSTEMRRAVTGLDISVNREGASQSKIRARELLETRMGKSLLEGIEAWDVNADGSVHNEIRSRKAEYDAERRTADFSGDVRVFFGEGIEVRTESLHYDWNSGIGETHDPLQFFFGGSSGKARGMRFDQKHKNLALRSEVDLVFPQERAGPGGSGSGRIRATADRAYATEETLQALLQGNARVESDTALLSAGSLLAVVGPDRKRVKSITADGGGFYESREEGETRRMTGHRIIFNLGEASGELENISVLGEAGFSSVSPDGEKSLNGAEIFVEMDPARGIPTQIASRTAARLRIQRGAEKTLLSGERLTARFAPATEAFESVHVAGRAAMSIQGAADSSGQDLQAEEIRLSFRQLEGEAAIEKLQAKGSVAWTLMPEQGKGGARREPSRTLAASQLEMHFSPEGNSLESGHAAGEVVVTEASDARHVRRMTADDARFFFFSGGNRLKNISADGHVRVAYEKGSSPSAGAAVERFRSESDKLRANFDLVDGESAVRTFSQWGSFRYIDEAWTATAKLCDYDADKGVLVLQGSPRIVSEETGATTGDRMEYDLAGKILSVKKHVRSKLAANGGKSFFGPSSASSSPSIILADMLQYWTENGRARYTGRVQLLSESGQLQTKSLEVAKGGERVDAEGEVVHLMPGRESSASGASKEEPKKASNSGDLPMIIESSGMTYLKEKNAITYMGNVRLRHDTLNLSSGSLEAVLDKRGNRVESATARDNVVIHQLDRECKGDTAHYYLNPGKFVVVGNPAEIVDPGKGRSYARRLTFFTADDRILIDRK